MVDTSGTPPSPKRPSKEVEAAKEVAKKAFDPDLQSEMLSLMHFSKRKVEVRERSEMRKKAKGEATSSGSAGAGHV
jgi:hypothetical protein